MRRALLIAVLGNVEAMRNLSQAYQKSIGVAVDLRKADEWERRARAGTETARPH